MNDLPFDEEVSRRADIKILTPDESTVFDVIVAGFGPVGMMCAILLAQNGLKVCAVERYSRLPAVTRAGGIDAETVRTFQYIGISDEFEKIARCNHSLKVVGRNNRFLQTFSALTRTTNGWKPFYTVYLPELESLLWKKAESLGVAIYMDQTITGVQQNSDRVFLTTRRTSAGDVEEKHTLQGLYLVAADGAKSFVRDSLGIENPDMGMEPIHNLVIDFEQANPDVDIPRIETNLHILDTRQPQLIGRWNGGRWTRTEIRLPENRPYTEDEKDVFAWDGLVNAGITPKHGHITRRSVYVCSSSLARTWRMGRVLLAGDSAHTMPPHAGQGMLSGIRDAMNLSWKLPAVIRGQADQKFLDTYETERYPHVRTTIETAMRLARLLLVHNPVIGWLRDTYLKFVQEAPTPSWPPLRSFLVRHRTPSDASLPEGNPTVQCRVLYKGKMGMLDDMTGKGWKLISRHPIPEAVLDKHSALIAALDMKILHITRATVEGAYIDIDGDYDAWYVATKRKVVIQRPDCYCYGTAASIDEASELLEGLTNDLVEAGWSKDNLTVMPRSTNGHKENSIGSLVTSNGSLKRRHDDKPADLKETNGVKSVDPKPADLKQANGVKTVEISA